MQTVTTNAPKDIMRSKPSPLPYPCTLALRSPLDPAVASVLEYASKPNQINELHNNLTPRESLGSLISSHAIAPLICSSGPREAHYGRDMAESAQGLRLACTHHMASFEICLKLARESEQHYWRACGDRPAWY